MVQSAARWLFAAAWCVVAATLWVPSLTHNVDAQDFHGRSCDGYQGVKGVCKLIYECPSLDADLDVLPVKDFMARHGPNCAFNSVGDKLLCCPEDVTLKANIERRNVTVGQPGIITSCPQQLGLQLYPHRDSCNHFYKCSNGVLTLEICENGLLFDGKEQVQNHCDYHWKVDCQGRKAVLSRRNRSPCSFDFGVFSSGICENTYYRCVLSEPVNMKCPKGLAFDNTIHSCNWPDRITTCNPTELVGFTCPPVKPGDPNYKFLPFPRYPSEDCERYYLCIEGNPRLVDCTNNRVFNEETLYCEDRKNVPKCT